MEIVIREAVEADADDCGRIAYEGFRAVNARHGMPPNFPSLEVAIQRIGAFIRHPFVFAVVAQGSDGRVVGFNFLSERDPIRAVGPIVVDPDMHSRGIGRRLMEVVLARARGARSIRLLQEAYNLQSLSLYTALGFDAKELMVVLAGTPKSEPRPDWEVRPLGEDDLAQCERLHVGIHGYTRTNELRDAVGTGASLAALRGGRVRAYLAAPTIWQANHGVAETEGDMRALLLGAAQKSNAPLSFLMPATQAPLYRWCLAEGFRTTRPMTLMSMGEYHPPKGTYFPSVLY
jgi:GNAT superfamily N-acetyltransferase